VRILAIDPGNRESAYAIIDSQTRRPIRASKMPNELLRDSLCVTRTLDLVPRVVIEMVESYGMSVGREVFDTCVWVGRFAEAAESRGAGVELIPRGEVKMHHCHSRAAKDSNIIQALVDRFASGEPNRGKGTKAEPGWFHGFAADMWQAYALAVLDADRLHPEAAAG
jgi:hypothetical protein